MSKRYFIPVQICYFLSEDKKEMVLSPTVAALSIHHEQLCSFKRGQQETQQRLTAPKRALILCGYLYDERPLRFGNVDDAKNIIMSRPRRDIVLVQSNCQLNCANAFRNAVKMTEA